MYNRYFFKNMKLVTKITKVHKRQSGILEKKKISEKFLTLSFWSLQLSKLVLLDAHSSKVKRLFSLKFLCRGKQSVFNAINVSQKFHAAVRKNLVEETRAHFVMMSHLQTKNLISDFFHFFVIKQD